MLELEFVPSTELPEKLWDAIIQNNRVGSSWTCFPVPSCADLDYLCYVDDLNEFSTLAMSFGFILENSENAERYIGCDLQFVSLRKGNVNLLATSKLDFYEKFLAATSVAKKLNLLKKSDRIDLFQAVLYAKECKP